MLEVVVMYSLSGWSEHGKGLEVLNKYFKVRVGGSLQSLAKLAIFPLFGNTADIGEYVVPFPLVLFRQMLPLLTNDIRISVSVRD